MSEDDVIVGKGTLPCSRCQSWFDIKKNYYCSEGVILCFECVNDLLTEFNKIVRGKNDEIL